MLPRGVASLPMYDWPEVHWATDALWSEVARGLGERGFAAPAALDRERDCELVWSDPDLVLSQTCGWPYATRLIGKVGLVATPVYRAPGCSGPSYCSYIIVRAEEAGTGLADFVGCRIAINGRDSLSGYVALVAAMHAAGLPVPPTQSWVETGSHRQSLRAVADGRADIAAIDAVCWALAERHDNPAVRRLKVLESTPLRPALPFITAGMRSEAEVALIRSAVADAIDSPGGRQAADGLFLARIEVLGPETYASLVHSLGGTHVVAEAASVAARG